MTLDSIVRFETPGLWLALAGFALIAGVVVLIRLDRVRGRRRRRRRRRRRTMAWVVACGCLWILFAKPVVRGPVAPSRAVLLTPGASDEDGRRLMESADSGLLFTTAGEVNSVDPDFRAIPDAVWMARSHPEISEVVVAGYGLESWELERLPFRVRAGREPQAGADRLAISWTREVVLGRSLVVRTRTEDLDPSGRLSLIGPEGEAAGVSLEDWSGAEVVLTARPKKSGRHLFRLELTDGAGDVRLSEPVGVLVSAPPRRRVLWLQASPSFEARHVKNWLVESGSELILRTRISRDRFHTEYVNRPPSRFRGFRRGELSQFELVVTDRRSLSDLGRGRRSELFAAVAEDGVGLLLLLPEGDTRRLGAPFAAFEVQQVGEADGLEARPRWAGASIDAQLLIGPREIRTANGSRPIVEDASGRVLAATAPYGKGVLGVSLFTDTFRWSLEGKADAFRSLWSRMVEQVSRSRSTASWRIPDEPILVDRPLEAVVLSSNRTDALPEVWIEDAEGAVPVAIHQDPLEPDRWALRLWPRRAGWHRLVLEPDEPGERGARGEPGESSDVWFHVAGPNEWSAWVNGERYSATLEAARRPGPANGQVLRRWRRVSAVPFFALLVAALGFLWFDERRSLTRASLDAVGSTA